VAAARTWVIHNAHVVDPAQQRDEPGATLYIHEGRMMQGLSAEQLAQAQHWDAKGTVLAPGLVDIHVHFREPGQTHKETVATGSRAAAAGGFTSVVCMPNTNPALDDPLHVRELYRTAAQQACVRVYTSAALTLQRKGQTLAPMGSLKAAGALAFTDDGECIQDHALMRRCCQYAAALGVPVFDHCQDESLTHGASMHEGSVSFNLGLKGWPRVAEDIIVARNLALAKDTGAHVHLQHLSSKYSVELVRQAKRQGIRVTAEVSPHHLYFTHEQVGAYNTLFKVNPPLREAEDREALIEGLLDGTLDCIATDHAPHTPAEKNVPFEEAPFGMLGLETALAATLEVLFHTGRCSLSQVISFLSTKPAQLMGLPAGSLAPGAPADLVAFDPQASWTVMASGLHSRSSNSPWLGLALRGQVRATFVGGQCVFSRDDDATLATLKAALASPPLIF
jgi:dihydroorotase